MIEYFRGQYKFFNTGKLEFSFKQKSSALISSI